MFDPSKCDPVLGQKVEEFLKKHGQNTPYQDNGLERKEKIDSIQSHFTEIMKTLGLDLTDDSLEDTPKRVAKMFVNEIFWGLDPLNFPKCTAIENKMDYDEMVAIRDINVMSQCEHHFIVIDGKATVAYIPNKKVIGLSKINRIVEYFCKRPQVQERLTSQIYYALQLILDTENIAVVIDASHYCVKSRGVEDINSTTFTSKLGGIFRDNLATRAEFLALARTK